MQVLDQILEFQHKKRKGLAILIDPDKSQNFEKRENLLSLINSSEADFLFVGGSLITQSGFDECLKHIKSSTNIPVILFPGDPSQISEHADAVLFLSLISGRNADLLIGKHVEAAPRIKSLHLETISTGYMIVDCGNATTASYMSQSFPIPYDKPEIAAVTALAGEMLGMQCMYLDGGSGAQKPISPAMISKVRKMVQLPLIVGGGIRNASDITDAYTAGADIVVVGTAVEESPEILFDLTSQKRS